MDTNLAANAVDPRAAAASALKRCAAEAWPALCALLATSRHYFALADGASAPAADAGRTWRLPRRHAPVAFALVMSGIMALVMSGVITAITRGVDAQFVSAWLRTDAIAWTIAFPLVALLAPRVRALVDRIVEPA
jgi:hypothetical protein